MRQRARPVAIATLIAASLSIGSRPAIGQPADAAALTGVVRSAAEGPMEGVVVSARRDGTVVTVSVVSDATGTFRFPRTHLDPGDYTLATRAVGYDLVGPDSVAVMAGGTTTADLELRETDNLGMQLSSREWAMSMPATPEERSRVVHQLLSCAYCHTYQRIMLSRHSAEQFLPVIQRMGTYYPDGAAVSNDSRRGRWIPNTEAGQRVFLEPPDWGFVPGVPKTELAALFAAANLSEGKETWDYELRTLPRPTGEATRVIITEYDLPTASTVAHDMDIDSNGTVWYTDESRQMIGKLVPGTATFTEYELPPVNEGDIPGTRDVQVDLDGMVWFPMRIPGSGTVLTRFDPRTEEMTTVDGQGGQFLALGPDGKIWTGFTRVDPATMQVDASFDYRDHVPSGAAPYASNSKSIPTGTPGWSPTAAPAA